MKIFHTPLRQSALRNPFTHLILISLTGMLGACSLDSISQKHEAVQEEDSSTYTNLSEEQLNNKAEYWANIYAANKQDKIPAINLSRILRALDRNLQAMIVMRQIIQYHPNDSDLLSELGKALIASGQIEDARQIIEHTRDIDAPDWRLLSAYGAKLDELGYHKQAQKSYREALLIVPDEPTVLNNLGLSYALDNNLAKAIETLRRAANHPFAPEQVKQNLALTLGLQGKFKEARSIAETTQSTATVSRNMDYLKKMVNQKGNWHKLRALENNDKKVEKP